MELNGLYKSLTGLMIGVDGSIVVTGINEEGKLIEEITRFQNKEVESFDAVLARYGLKNILMSFSRAHLQIAHVRAKSTIREVGESLVDDLIRGRKIDYIIEDELADFNDGAWDAWTKAREDAADKLILGAVIKDLDKLMEEVMDTKKPVEEKAETTQCANCLALVEGKTLTCMTCGMEDLGPCCIAVDDHPCEDAEEEDEG